MSNAVIKYKGVSQILAGNDNSIRKNSIPNKYKYKVRRLERLFEKWEKWATELKDS